MVMGAATGAHEELWSRARALTVATRAPGGLPTSDKSNIPAELE